MKEIAGFIARVILDTNQLLQDVPLWLFQKAARWE
jgi:hypothetical protein